jgi:hypothetical protein
MTKDHTRHLFEKYPLLYRGATKPITQSLMAFGFECGDGWFRLIDGLSEKLERLNAEHPDSPTEAVQVKEKFASLRFYVDGATDEAYKLIDAAERESETTCETCGKPGTVRGQGWIKCCCDECWDGATDRPKR